MPHPEDLDVPDATPTAGFACPDLTTFRRLDELYLIVTGQRLEPDLTWDRPGSAVCWPFTEQLGRSEQSNFPRCYRASQDSWDN